MECKSSYFCFSNSIRRDIYNQKIYYLDLLKAVVIFTFQIYSLRRDNSDLLYD